VPELDNLSLHNSGEIMKKAFEKVITHPIKTVEKVGKEAASLVTKIRGHPLKILLTIAAIATLVVILAVLAKKLIKRKTRHNNNLELRTIRQVETIPE